MASYSLIAAVGENNEIGYNGCLPWELPADMQHFKEITTGHTIIMGRKTWDSLSVKPLPSRRNIVLTSHPQLIEKHAETATTIDEILKLFQDVNDEIFIIGGAELFSIFVGIADKIYLTRIHHSFKADSFFPEIDFSRWRLLEEKFISKNIKNKFDITFQTYDKICK